MRVGGREWPHEGQLWMFTVVLGQKGYGQWREQWYHTGDNLECSRQSDMCNTNINIPTLVYILYVSSAIFDIWWYQPLQLTPNDRHSLAHVQVRDWSPGGRLHQDRQVLPWDCSPGYRLHQDRQVFPWHLSRSYQETDYMNEYVCACVCVYD